MPLKRADPFTNATMTPAGNPFPAVLVPPNAAYLNGAVIDIDGGGQWRGQ